MLTTEFLYDSLLHGRADLAATEKRESRESEGMIPQDSLKELPAHILAATLRKIESQ